MIIVKLTGDKGATPNEVKEIERYLNDLDNLIDTGNFPDGNLREYTFYHQEMTLKEFVGKGREIIRQSLQVEKAKNP